MAIPTCFFVTAVIITLVWLLFLFKIYLISKNIPNLDVNSKVSISAEGISVVIAAKDEEAIIKETVESILLQNYPLFELIVVNDRSTDNTSEILDQLQRKYHSVLKVLHISSVPDGWGGQNHAIFEGIKLSQYEWYCFTDADCLFESSNSLSIAMTHVTNQKLDLLSILPRLAYQSVLEKLYLPLCVFTLLIQLKIGNVNDENNSSAYANGAFIICKKKVYQKNGGHEAVRHYLNDDIALAEKVKHAGYKIQVVSNNDLVTTKMYKYLKESWNGWIRNFTGTLQTTGKLLNAVLFSAILFLLPYIGLIVSGVYALADHHWITPLLSWSICVMLMHAILWRIYKAYGLYPVWSLVYFPGALFVSGVLIFTMVKTLFKPSITWHNISYGEQTNSSRK